MHEVPLPQRTLLALDDQQRLAGEHEEVLLVGLPVVHRHGVARFEGDEMDPHLPELGLTLERPVGATPLGGLPGDVTRVEDEPAVPLRDKPVLGRL